MFLDHTYEEIQRAAEERRNMIHNVAAEFGLRLVNVPLNNHHGNSDLVGLPRVMYIKVYKE